MFARYFISRPVFASVISILLVLVGMISYINLPRAQYPDIAPPTIYVIAQYPGADAQTVSDTVAVPLEERINGVENMLYMESICTNDGQCRIVVTFRVGTDLNMAQVLVQNRVALGTPKLPEVTRALGVATYKRSPTMIMFVNMFSPTGEYDQVYISNYTRTQVMDVLSRLKGVGDAVIYGEKEYSMRIWLNPDQMAQRNLTAADVSRAIKEQNIQVAAGQLGQQPVDTEVPFQYILKTKGRLPDEEEFGNIVIKTDQFGQLTRIRDVARVEIGAKSIDVVSFIDGDIALREMGEGKEDVPPEMASNVPNATLGIALLPGANALETAKLIRAKMKELALKFPPGLKYTIVHDTTPFIEESIHEVLKTTVEATILVVLVVLIFLQSWRATLIPLLAIPVSLIGTFAVMMAFGFSLNNLSMFGIVLAIGIVVDNAIVVVEAIESHIEEGMEPREAAIKAMDEISGALIGITLALSCVFVPCAFITGVTGEFFKQFALTIAVSTIISTVNSLTLSPALGAMILKSRKAKRDPLTWLIDVCFGWFFKLFNFTFKLGTSFYVGTVRWCLRLSLIALVIYGGLLFMTYKVFTTVETGFIPQQDRGYVLVILQLPDSASLDRTKNVVAEVQNRIHDVPGIRAMICTDGMSIITLSNTSNCATITVELDSFADRKKSGITDLQVVDEIKRRVADIRDASINVVRPAPIDGMGQSSGFKLHLQDRGGLGATTLQEMADTVIHDAQNTKGLTSVYTQYRANTPQMYVNIDRDKAIAMGISLKEIFTALQSYLASEYVNDLTYVGRNFQVKLQADCPYRLQPEDLNRIHVRNGLGEMVPLGSVLTVEESSGPMSVNRFNMFRSAAILGAPDGVSSGTSMELIEKICAKDLPNSMSTEWCEMGLLEKEAGNSAMYVFAASVIFVFLVLAAQYESWTQPLAVILVVPMCLLCSLVGVIKTGGNMNIFTQIGFLVLVGLACKNAILIVEFAKQNQNAGMDRVSATLEACRQRLRPILMTSLAFILGVVPLLYSTGAGWEMRRILGTAVFSGMLGVTFFGIFLTPVFYSVIMKVFGRRSSTATQSDESQAPAIMENEGSVVK